MRRAAARRRTQPPLADLPNARRSSYPGFIGPCLATARTSIPAHGYWIHEIKHDGYRAQAHIHHGKTTLFTRNGDDWTDRFRQIAEALAPFAHHELILDGEIVVLDSNGVSDFHLLQERLARNHSSQLIYLLFDLLYLDGFDLRAVPLIERRRILSQLLENRREGGPIQFSPHIEADATAVFNQACAMHLEGIVSKESQSAYRSGRQETWIKIKCAQADTFPIVAFVEKLGASPRRIASLYLGRWEANQLLYAGKAQIGFQHHMLYELRERLDPYIRETSPLTIPVKKPKATWVEPALLAEIQYSALTTGQRLRAPIFKGIRDDLMAPRRGPKRAAKTDDRTSRVSQSSVLQLLPDAVVPTKEQLRRYWTIMAHSALPYLARRPLKLVRHDGGITYYHKGTFPPVPKSVHQL